MNNSVNDPWRWGFDDNATEDQQQSDWNNLWNNPNANNFRNIKVKNPVNEGSDYFDTINLSQQSQSQQNWGGNGGGGTVQSNYSNYLPQANAANFFNNNSSLQSDVENKEVAPPDIKYNSDTEDSILQSPSSGPSKQEINTDDEKTSFQQNFQKNNITNPFFSQKYPLDSRVCQRNQHYAQVPLLSRHVLLVQDNQLCDFKSSQQIHQPQPTKQTLEEQQTQQVSAAQQGFENQVNQSLKQIDQPQFSQQTFEDQLSQPPPVAERTLEAPFSQSNQSNYSSQAPVQEPLNAQVILQTHPPQGAPLQTYQIQQPPISSVYENQISQNTTLTHQTKENQHPIHQVDTSQVNQQPPPDSTAYQSDVTAENISNVELLQQSKPNNQFSNTSQIVDFPPSVDSQQFQINPLFLYSDDHVSPKQNQFYKDFHEEKAPKILVSLNSEQLNIDKDPSYSDSQTFVGNSSKSVTNSFGNDKSLSMDNNQLNKPNSSSDNINLQNKDCENVDKTAAATAVPRYTPSPKQTIHAQTPSSVPLTQSNKHQHNINCTVSSSVTSNTVAENLLFDNETQAHNLSTASRSQMSFNFKNGHPMASSSPVATSQRRTPPSTVPDNQERLPENHEMPDNTENLHHELNKLSINKKIENDSKVHCQVDRNQYLETGHLSGSKDPILTDNSPNVEAIDESEAPPPGLHRLVTGQGCESRGPTSDHLAIGANSSTMIDDNRTRPSSPSTVDSDTRNDQNRVDGESEVHPRTNRLVPGQSIGDETDGIREVVGQATPLQNRIVLGQMGDRTDSPTLQDSTTNRGDNTREIVGRMVVGERYDDRDLAQNVNVQDDFRQSHSRSLRRNRRGESSYEEEDHDYPSDRDRRGGDDYKRRSDERIRHRSRREHRSPDYRSDEEYEDRRGFNRMSRSDRRPRDFSPEVDYYNNYRDDHRRHRRYDHYRDYDEDYYHRENRSRPSSRTGSDYRRGMDYMYSRVPMNMFYPGVSYNPRAPEEYYETMRRLNPVMYAEWYNQYMSNRYNVQQSQAANYNNDRASVHSGQSSNNNRQNISTPQADVEVEEEMSADLKDGFVNSAAYLKAKFDNFGRLIIIDPHYPAENQKPTVNILNLNSIAADPDTEEFLESPGPFVPGVTHRNTVLQYLKWISDKSTKSSEKLLYDLIQLTIKSNGELNGLDVAELLMESYRKSKANDGINDSESVEQMSATQTLTKFRELLQQGNKMEALEWAISNGAWGHALFLASKMDEKTHNNIMLRFANSIPHNDPLQTLYQLMSGHVPQASSCCGDKNWSDWRPHLAMILGNPTGNPKLDRKAIIKLGDTLFSRGRICASHVCYITAQLEFTSYQRNAKFVLLGSNPNQEFLRFATCRAIMVTMCFEYGLKLRQNNANIPTLQLYKLVLATRLIDHGKLKIALQYLELIANEALQKDCCERYLIARVIDLSTKLKMLDPKLVLTGDAESDPDWLTELKNFYNNLSEDYDTGLTMQRGVSSSTVSEVGQDNYNTQQDKVDNNAQETVNTQNNLMIPAVPQTKPEFFVPTSVEPIQQPLQLLSIQTSLPPSDIIQHPSIDQLKTYQSNSLPPMSTSSYGGDPYAQQPASIDPYWNISNNSSLPTPNAYPPQETMQDTTNTTATTTGSTTKNNFFKASEEQLKLHDISKDNNRSSNPIKPAENKSEESSQNSGWFGGILEKFSIRPKNQMRLPDDSNPSIVWDSQKKKWVNLEDEGEETTSVKPPPSMAETIKPQPIPDSLPVAGPPSVSNNKYKIQKGKMMKSNYVNIMSNSTTSKPQSNIVRPMDVFPNPAQPNNTNFFIPQPAEGNEYPVDYANSGSILAGHVNKPVDNSLENKQQDYSQGMMTAPTMYNPARFPPASNDC